MKEKYLKQQANKILDFARELYQSWNITKKQLNETYYHNFYK